jgi:hypothetical protein
MKAPGEQPERVGWIQQSTACELVLRWIRASARASLLWNPYIGGASSNQAAHARF